MQWHKQCTSSPVEYPAELLYSSGTRWSGLRLDKIRTGTGEFPEAHLTVHTLVLHTRWPLHHEIYCPEEGWQKFSPNTNLLQFIPAGIPIAANWKGTCEAIVLYITPEFVTSTYGPDSRANGLPPAYRVLRNELVTELMLSLDRAVRQDLHADTLYGQSLGSAIIAELLKYYSNGCTGSLPSASPERIESVLKYIDGNLAADLSLIALASIAGVSVERLLQLFKLRTRCTPHQYILRQRIVAARRLLTNRDSSIAEVAHFVGFQDQSHFCKVFRGITGTSPRVYQQSARRQAQVPRV